MFVRRLFFLTVVFISTTAFFWDDDEKQVKQLYQTAEAAFTTKKFEEAVKAYDEVLNKVDSLSWQKVHMDWRTYVDTTLRLCIAYESLEKYEEAVHRLNKLLAKRPPEEFHGQIKILKARLSNLHSPQDQYCELKKVHDFYSEDLWKKEDLSFFLALEFSLNSQYDNLIHKAKRHQIAGSYKEAITLYEELLLAIEKGYYPKVHSKSFLAKKIRFHLAECHYAAHHYEQALNLCEKTHFENNIDREMIYLSALCFKEKQEYEKSLELFQRYFSSGNRKDLEHYDHALFEIGYFYFRKNQFGKAKRYFELLHNFDEMKKRPALLAAVYLAKIALHENAPEKVDGLLSFVTTEFSTTDPIRYECFFLRGQAFFLLRQYALAKEFFEKSLPTNKSFGELTRYATYYLGLSYLKLADAEKNPLLKSRFFAKAEEILNRLCKNKNWDEPRLALAKLYLLKNKEEPEQAFEKVHMILSEQFETFSLGSRLEALLLRAEASLSFEAKEAFYKTASETIYSSLSKYPEALMLRGLNFFHEGLKNKSSDKNFFEQASLCFEKAFCKVDKTNSENAARLLKLEATTNFFRNEHSSSLSLLEKLLSEFNEEIEGKEETLYLKGLIAAKLNDSAYFSIAEQSFQQVIRDFPNGKMADRALHMLGTLYYNQKNYEKACETFVQLGNLFPNSLLTPDGLFWAAESLEKLAKDATAIRRQIYDRYPHCTRAADAYFRLYTYHDYLEKDQVALSHLKEFPHLFPHSELLVCVNCLLGMNETQLEPAEAFFEEALASFQTFINEGKTFNASLIYFRYRTLLELAQLYLLHGKKLDKAVSLLSSINQDFTNESPSLVSFLKEKSLYPSIFEESEYTLARVFLKMGLDARALECFASMLKHYNEAKITKGTFLSLLWREQGKLAMKANDFDTALKCFDIASNCGQDHLSDDHILTLWILQSNCYKEKRDYDQAMRLLSKVINADMVSNLRLEAMSLRAEIYELQNRPELALRQLEAAAKKGSLEAQEKLEQVIHKVRGI